MIRWLYMGGGLLAVGLGIIGAFLPIMPTVPFLILAVFCFARSEPEWERRLLEHTDVRHCRSAAHPDALLHGA